MTKVTQLTVEEGGGQHRRRIHLREISGDSDTPLETVGQDLRAARLRLVLTQASLERDHLGGGGNVIDVDLLEPVDHGQDGAQLLSVERLLSRFQTEPSQECDMPNVVGGERHRSDFSDLSGTERRFWTS